jgi:pilus assembly protein Flp/PilA
MRPDFEGSRSTPRRKKCVEGTINNLGTLRRKEVIAEVSTLYWKLRGLLTKQEGQGMVEYALILVLVSIVVIVILLTMGGQIKNVFSNVVTALNA